MKVEMNDPTEGDIDGGGDDQRFRRGEEWCDKEDKFEAWETINLKLKTWETRQRACKEKVKNQHEY